MKQRNIYLGSLYLLGLLCAQRFAFPDYYQLACAIPLACFLWRIAFQNKVDSLLIMAALLMSVDHGAGVYRDTPSFVRYMIYLCCLLLVIYPARFNIRASIAVLGLSIVPISIAAASTELIHTPTLIRDLFALFLVFIVVAKSVDVKKQSAFEFDGSGLCALTLGLLTAEIANAMLWFDLGYYLNYHSLKSIIIFPSLYFLWKKQYATFVLIGACTFYVLIMYVSRMIIVTWLALILIHSLIFVFQKKYTARIILVYLTISLAALFVLDQVYLGSFKFTSMFIILSDSGNFIEFAKAIDPVRYAEILLLLDNNFVNIFFGKGFGAGIMDDSGVLSFIRNNDWAFSDTELREGFFYNFHDIYVDIGIRFGLIYVLLVYLLLAKWMIEARSDQAGLLSAILIVLVTNAYFSSGGLLLIALLSISLRYQMQSYRDLSNVREADVPLVEYDQLSSRR